MIAQIYTNKALINYAKRVTKGNDLWQDIMSELVVYLSGIDKDKLKDLIDKKQITAYCCKIIYYSWNSPTSPFYKTYLSKNLDLLVNYSYSLEPEEEVDYDLIINNIEKKEKHYPFAIALLKRYSELKSYQKLHDEIKNKTGNRIPYTTIVHIIEGARAEIKKNI